MSIRAIILSGGRSNRFGGVHKPAVELGGTTVISRILGTVRTARPPRRGVGGRTDVMGCTAREHGIRAFRFVEEPVFAGPSGWDRSGMFRISGRRILR